MYTTLATDTWTLHRAGAGASTGYDDVPAKRQVTQVASGVGMLGYASPSEREVGGKAVGDIDAHLSTHVDPSVFKAGDELVCRGVKFRVVMARQLRTRTRVFLALSGGGSK